MTIFQPLDDQAVIVDIVCDSTAVHPSRPVARMRREAIFGWIPGDRRIRDLSDKGADGYSVRCHGCGDRIAVHAGDLHYVLERLAEEGRRVVTIRDLQAIRRHTAARLRGPQQRPGPPDLGGFLMSGRSA